LSDLFSEIQNSITSIATPDSAKMSDNRVEWNYLEIINFL